MEKETTTELTVAEWMRDQLETHGRLRHRDAVCLIRQIFGDEYTYRNGNGHFAIAKPVLRMFRKIAHNVVWDRRYRRWFRRRTLAPASNQD